MKEVMHNNGTRKAVSEFHASVPTWRAPRIKGTVCRNGTTYYKGVNGKLYVPHLYDAMFKTVKGVVMDKLYKGVNPGLKYQ